MVDYSKNPLKIKKKAKFNFRIVFRDKHGRQFYANSYFCIFAYPINRWAAKKQNNSF